MEKIMQWKKTPAVFVLKCLLCSWLVTAVLLLLMALGVYQLGLSERVVSVMLILVYVAATFLGGFLAGRKMQRRKFLWGFLVGTLYFGSIVLISLLTNASADGWGGMAFPVVMLCIAGGTLGGMLG